MPTESVTAPAVRTVPFDGLRAFPDLFKDYTARYTPLAEFYAGDFRDPEARRGAADRAAAYERDRATVADVLLEQNEAWGLNEATRAHIEALRDPATVAVVTGQQVGLFGGPLYTLYKTITALQLAEQVAEETGRRVVPVFWVEGEDHDYDEIAGIRLLRGNEPVAVRYDHPATVDTENPGAVGRLALGDEIEAVLDQVEAALAPTDFRDDVLAALREAYAPDRTLEDAFVRVMRRFFPDAGLVYLNADDARLKRLVAPLYRREIEDGAALAAAIRTASERLVEAGYHAQVNPRPSNLFLLDDEGRYALDLNDDGTFTARGQDRTFTQADLLDLLERAPERFSPNVILRPLTQDVLVPTMAYVAGPGEVSYFAQYKPAYAWAEIPMPLIHPRASATLVEGKVQKVLDRYSFTVADLDEELDKLFRHLVLDQLEVDLDAVFKEANGAINRALNDLKPPVEAIDQTLGRSLEGTRAALMKEVAGLKSRVVRAERRNQDEVRGQLEKAQVNLYPGGTPQERALSVLYFLNKYSPDLLRRLRADLSTDTTAHQVLEL